MRILEQVAGLADAEASGGAPGYRDQAMAENVEWILGQAPKQARIVLWAHNGHLARELDGWANMGSHLAARHGAAYLVFGFVFAEGSFQAMDYTTGTGRGLNEFTLGPPLETDAAVAFSRTGHPLLVADLRTAAGAVAAWFAAPHHRRDTGAVFTSEENMTILSWLSREVDAVIFVDKTTRARPLQR